MRNNTKIHVVFMLFVFFLRISCFYRASNLFNVPFRPPPEKPAERPNPCPHNPSGSGPAGSYDALSKLPVCLFTRCPKHVRHIMSRAARGLRPLRKQRAIVGITRRHL